MTYLLDTCVISEMTRKKPEARVAEWLQRQPEETLFLSVLTLGEIEKGIAKLSEGPKRTRLREWVEQDLSHRFAGRLLAVDSGVACRWGELSGAAERTGDGLPVIDSLLAATALHAGMTVVTRDTQHFEACGARVHNPWIDSDSAPD